MCWSPVFVQDYMENPYYETLHSLKYTVQDEPVFKETMITSAYMNRDMVMLNIEGSFLDGDSFTMAWKGYQYSDCNPANFIGDPYTYNHTAWPGIWMGYESGVHGVYYIKNTPMDELQACWRPSSDSAPDVYIRIKKEELSAYIMRYY